MSEDNKPLPITGDSTLATGNAVALDIPATGSEASKYTHGDAITNPLRNLTIDSPGNQNGARIPSTSTKGNEGQLNEQINELRQQMTRMKMELAQSSQQLIVSPGGDNESALYEQTKTLQRRINLINDTIAVMLLDVKNKKYDNAQLEQNERKIANSSLSNTNIIVPPNLPMFQWKGMSSVNQHFMVFNSSRACFRHFENVIKSHMLNIDSEWARLLPRCLNENKYGLSKEQRQSISNKKLQELLMLKHESIDQFIDRFNDLRKEAGATNTAALFTQFTSALPSSLYKRVVVSIATSPEANKSNLEHAITTARNIYNYAYRDMKDHIVKRRALESVMV
ncbi:MAG: hypothetical protein EXX96DRAFT_648891 [Benjaminiella poitrasii]|nr:MAG: hypothetical protein EXX96DRAFT_648891 [Benjaminiella poitrasii]